MWDSTQILVVVIAFKTTYSLATSFPRSVVPKLCKNREYQQELRFCHLNQIKLKLNADVLVVCLCVLATAKIHQIFCIQIVSLQKIYLKLS